jgi:hypothetical protein
MIKMKKYIVTNKIQIKGTVSERERSFLLQDGIIVDLAQYRTVEV